MFVGSLGWIFGEDLFSYSQPFASIFKECNKYQIGYDRCGVGLKYSNLRGSYPVFYCFSIFHP